MGSYNKSERCIAALLEKFPRVKQHVKSIYQRLNYFIFADKNFRCSLQSPCTMQSVYGWAGVQEEKGELFFGYYDKSPWLEDMTKAVFHRVNESGDVDIVLFDNVAHKATVLGTSKTWNTQQGSMAQWLRGKKEEQVIFNDLAGDRFVSRVVDVNSRKVRTVPWPIQTLHPNGNQALTLNYRKLAFLRPEYGYRAECGNFAPFMPEDRDGIWHVDLNTGKAELVITLQHLMQINPRPEMDGARHKVNHIMFSRKGTRFVFMHRWLGREGKFSRLYVADSRSYELRILMDERMVSHYSWKDENHLIVYGRTVEKGDRYYLINVETGDKVIIGEGVLDCYGDGHPSYSPDGRYIVTDTYPDRERKSHLMIYDLERNKVTEVATLFAPLRFSGGDRCDFHPRWAKEGRALSFDCAYQGFRYSYVLRFDSQDLSKEEIAR